MLSQGFNSFIFLLLVWSLQASNHCLYICWQCRFIAEVVVAQPSFFVGPKVLGNCFDGGFVHLPWITRVHERAGFFGTLPSLAGKIRADLLGKVSWEDVHDSRFRIPQVEHTHLLLICTSGFNYLYLFVGFCVRFFVVFSLQVSRVAFCVSTSCVVGWVCAWCGRLWKERIGGCHGAVLRGYRSLHQNGCPLGLV